MHDHGPRRVAEVPVGAGAENLPWGQRQLEAADGRVGDRPERARGLRGCRRGLRGGGGMHAMRSCALRPSARVLIPSRGCFSAWRSWG